MAQDNHLYFTLESLDDALFVIGAHIFDTGYKLCDVCTATTYLNIAVVYYGTSGGCALHHNALILLLIIINNINHMH